MITVENQTAKDYGMINNAQQINNIIFDSPLKFFCDKKKIEKPELDTYLQVMQYIVNTDKLKMRFDGINYKYRSLIDFLDDYINEKVNISPDLLDDGYKSIIMCIVKVVSYFKLKVKEGVDCLEINICNNLIADIESSGLKIKYTKEINNNELYREAKSKAEYIIKELAPYINCAAQYGNFFQFNNIFLEEIKNVPFVAKEVKFQVSNEIIPNLIKPLYGESPECGLREIIQNACDASKELRKIKGQMITEKLKVEMFLLTTDNNRKLLIRDYGIGMTEDVLLNKYFVIGESSKKDSNLDLVGQFGIGALATFLLGNEIEVKTKNYNESNIYHFTYTLDSNKNKSINIIIESDEDFLCGTEITVILNNKLAELSNTELEKKLKINEWYTLPDFPIEYYINTNKQEILTLNGDEFDWINLIEKKSLSVKYLNNRKYNNAKIIFNGLVVPEPYEFKCKYLKKKPYISIRSYENSLKLNLERSRIDSGLDIVISQLEQELIRLSLEELKSQKERIVNEDKIIIQFEYNSEYLREIPLFFCQDGFGIYSKKTINALISRKIYKTVIRVYGYNGYPAIKLSNLSVGVIYLFYRATLNKSNIANLIEREGTTHIPNEVIKKFFYNATSQYNGFKVKTMERIYFNFNEKFPGYSSVNEFWQKHNSIKETKFINYFSEPEYISIGNSKHNVDIDELQKICNSSIINIVSLNTYQYYYKDIVCEDMDIGIIE